MSGFGTAPRNPDGRIFASYPMPAKIDLLNEAPRRESLVEQQLGGQIQSSWPPKIQISSHSTHLEGSRAPNQQETVDSINLSRRFDSSHQIGQSRNEQVQQHLPPLQSQTQQRSMIDQTTNVRIDATNNMGASFAGKNLNNAANLAAELAAKEARLMADIAALHQRPYSPYQVPNKIDLTIEQREAQRQYQNAPTSRPQSRASSTRCTSADLIDKEAKLLQEIEEMGRKPYNPQTMVVEREQWFEYPQGRPNDRQLTDSKRRIKDFCSLPHSMYPEEGLHMHEDNLPLGSHSRPSSSASIHTAIIRSPKREIDNKSPLPFAFDNFTTKGVRGNIASVGAIEPDRPRPPIYPIIKRTPSPSVV